ncbi:histone acetyltransferase KAT7 [Anthonomus grandis grandis]|uniref:histone acetyltransferase KAT7 n=1 Tax=Anthonomus grandis grandis TaxID=2921223 RepID=UPI002165ACE7|nr:histone acetyltransferase KAT7 [Anthonomus grandis grandis]
MTGKKKPASSTDSSTESSSGSSSSSSSATGTNSSSSSDSDSSSSQESTRNSSNESGKKTAPPQKSQRKSTENSKPTSSTAKPEQKSGCKKSQTGKSPSKTQQKPVSADSTEDEEERPKQVKRKSNVKPKASATINPKQPATSNSSNREKSSNQKSSGGKTVPPSKGKGKEVARPKTKSTSKVIDPKKKSIFSPENSSDSEGGKPSNKGPSKSVSQAKPKAEPRPKAAAKPVEKARNERKKEDSPEKKSADETTASSATSTTGTSSSSETDSSADDSENDRKVAVKKPVKKPSVVAKENGAGSESEAESNKKQVTRKSTRSASTRKSKHVLGKNQYSDTDSESESTKRSLSRSPVKKAPGTTKGKTKNNKKNDAKSKINEVVFVERQCPLEGCDSMGHLSGKFEKHFVLEACPTYHNITFAKCKSELNERKKREELRSKALEQFNKSPGPNSTHDQKQYLTKIKDLRNKFKQEKEPVEDIKPTINKNKEPDLNNFVPEYDLKLFRDAQALASEKIEAELKMLPSTKGTKSIEMGKFEMEVWYQSPYPEDYARLPKLYICEFCLRYMKSRTILERHVIKCVWKHPPGDEVYRKDKVSVWEVDGKKYKQYCQNLCLLAKFFLDHKTLYYDVEPFLFYIMTLHDNEGCHTVGYFSKEKNSFLNYNVSCILTLPPYQRQGYGRLLIDFSYLLTRVEGKIGSPEKPLSDLGLISYRSYWKDVLLNYLCSRAGTTLSVKDISQEMAIHSYDIVSTLQALGMMKYWKGKHIILKKQDVLDEYVERVQRRASQQKEIDPTCLRWIPPQSQTSV